MKGRGEGKIVDSALRNQLLCAKFTDLELHRMYLLCKGNRLIRHNLLGLYMGLI